MTSVKGINSKERPKKVKTNFPQTNSVGFERTSRKPLFCSLKTKIQSLTGQTGSLHSESGHSPRSVVGDRVSHLLLPLRQHFPPDPTVCGRTCQGGEVPSGKSVYSSTHPQSVLGCLSSRTHVHSITSKWSKNTILDVLVNRSFRSFAHRDLQLH